MTISNQILDIIDQAEKFRNAYFFTPPAGAKMRRSYERYNSRDEITWQDGKDTFSAAFDVTCSCSNVYAKGRYTRNGKKTTLTAIKNSYKRMAALDAASPA